MSEEKTYSERLKDCATTHEVKLEENEKDKSIVKKLEKKRNEQLEALFLVEANKDKVKKPLIASFENMMKVLEEAKIETLGTLIIPDKPAEVPKAPEQNTQAGPEANAQNTQNKPAVKGTLKRNVTFNKKSYKAGDKPPKELVDWVEKSNEKNEDFLN